MTSDPSRFLWLLGALAVLACAAAVQIASRTETETAKGGRFAVGTLSLDPQTLAAALAADAQGVAAAATGVPTVQIWYPADIAPLQAGRWARLTGRGAGDDARAPEQDADVLAKGGRFPLVVYQSGWPGTAPANRSLIETLARRGFIVAAMLYPPDEAERDAPVVFTSEAAYAQTMAEADSRVRARAADAARLLDVFATAAWSEQPVMRAVSRRIDFARVAAIGYSFGGAIAADVCVLDPRFRAAVNLDGWHFAEAASRGVPCPYLLISDDTPLPSAADLAASDPRRRLPAQLTQTDYDMLVAHLTQRGGTLTTIGGSDHAALGEPEGGYALLDRLRGRAAAQRRVAEMIDAYVTAFIAFHLDVADGRTPPAPPGDVARRFPKIRVQTWEPTATASAGQ